MAFSNDRIYGGALTTFPGVARDDCLRHVVVAQEPGPGQESSVTAEVTEVVRLVLEHARTRPKESLGVIALGMRHAERIDAASGPTGICSLLGPQRITDSGDQAGADRAARRGMNVSTTTNWASPQTNAATASPFVGRGDG